jgi:nitrite reductase (NADH) large subunit
MKQIVREEKKRVIIIGNSAAGLSALEAIRKRDQKSKILIIDKEPFPAYSRVITPYFIMGEIQKEENLFLKPKDFYQELDVKTLFGRKVQSIDISKREVILDHGKKEPFDLLLIASGSSPNRPKIRGAKSENIHVLRDLSDAKSLRDMRPRVQNILFMGGGLVSLQTLQAMYRVGGKFTLVVKSDQILSQTVDHEASEIIERHLEKMGICIIKGRDVSQVKRRNGSMKAILDNGEEIEIDILFAGKGVKPNVSLLEGTKINIQRSILVNSYMETNIEGIYAAGDVAQVPDFFSSEKVNYGLWPSAVEQGEMAGRNMTGLKEIYPGNLRMNVTRIFGMPIVSIGDFGSKRVAEILKKKDEKRNVYRKFCLDEKGILIGAILVNQVEDLGVIQGLIRARKDVVSLKFHSFWKSKMDYGFVYKNVVERRLQDQI